MFARASARARVSAAAATGRAKKPRYIAMMKLRSRISDQAPDQPASSMFRKNRVCQYGTPWTKRSQA